MMYINEHPFERPVIPNMKKDLLKRFKRRDCGFKMAYLLFLTFCSFTALFMGRYIAIIGVALFLVLFYLELMEFIGMPVRRWVKGDIDYKALEESYTNGLMLTYKKNGFSFGTTHIHAFTDKKIYAIDYRLVEGISRKVIRVKNYEDGLYSSEEYKHYAVIHVRLPNSGRMHDVEIELNEFQVQMVIDNLSTYKYKVDNTSNGEITFIEDKTNTTIT